MKVTNSENDKIDRSENVFIVVVISSSFDDVTSMPGKCRYSALTRLTNMLGDAGCRRGDTTCHCSNARNHHPTLSCPCKTEVEKPGVMLAVLIIKFFLINACALKVQKSSI